MVCDCGWIERRLIIAVVCLGLGMMCAEGWQGPIGCTVAATLPHHLKSFAIAQYSAVTYLISPAASNIMGIYLQVQNPF